jgi:hypothetical protein
VAGREDLAQRFDVHIGVNGCGFETGVAKELLNVADVRAAVEQVQGAEPGVVGRSVLQRGPEGGFLT